MFALVLFFLLIIIGIGIPIIISFLIYKWIKKKGYDKRLRLLALLPVVIIGYLIYDSIYPSTGFYEIDFKEVTNMKFPKSGEIKYKIASFPDHFGDYTSSFLVELEQNDLKKLENHIKNNGFEEKVNKMSSEELEYIELKKGRKDYTKQYVLQTKKGKHYFVGFLDDKKSVIITRVSW